MNAKLDFALDILLGVLASPAGAAIDPKVPEGAAQLGKLLRTLRAGVATYEQTTGEDLDMAKLHQIAPLPVPEEPEGEPV